jgi:AI-2 transport protein TqsA
VIFWGWIWSVAGALLAVPLTITIILFCAHVPALQPITILLGADVDGDAWKNRALVPKSCLLQ